MNSRSSRAYWRGAAIGVPLGLVLLGVSLFLRIRHVTPVTNCAVLFLSGMVIYVWACWALARAKGYGAAILLTLGLGLVVTPILLLLLPDNRRQGGRRSGRTGSDGGDWPGAGYRKTSPSQEASQIVLGWVLGLLSVPIGVGAIVGYEFYWARVLKPQREGLAAAVPTSPETPDARNEGKFVHVVGKLAGTEKLTDPDFGVAVDALKLRRRVWMYQWEQGSLRGTSSLSQTDEHGKTVWKVKSKTYDYSRVWSEEVIDSSAFFNAGHDNPAVKTIPSRAVSAARISLGAFALSPELVAQIDNHETVPLGEAALSALAEPLRAEAKLVGDEVYVGGNPQKPAIGDLKIRVDKASAAVVSVIARQCGHTLLPGAVGRGGTVAMLRVGTHSLQEMSGEVAKANLRERATVWGVGAFACFMGLVFIRVARRRSRQRVRVY